MSLPHSTVSTFFFQLLDFTLDFFFRPKHNQAIYKSGQVANFKKKQRKETKRKTLT